MSFFLIKFFAEVIGSITSSFYYYTFLLSVFAISLLFALAGANYSSFFSFSFILLLLLHGVSSLSHIIEDYTFSYRLKVLYVFLLNLILLRATLLLLLGL